MRPWIERHFGDVESTLSQRIIRVTNLVTCRGALFNAAALSPPALARRRDRARSRARRRTPTTRSREPLADTPADVFGRIEGKYCVTGANVAKFDGFHSLVIFKEHNPLRFDREMLHDYFDVGLRWAEAAHDVDPAAKYYLFMWNCLWRAGASLVHGHAQVLLGRDAHYPAVERLRRDAADYRARYDANYFDDLFRAHAAVGCGFEKDGVRVLANLAPVKENEVLLIAPALTRLAQGPHLRRPGLPPRPARRRLLQSRALPAASRARRRGLDAASRPSSTSSTAATSRPAPATSAPWSCTPPASSPATPCNWRACCGIL